MQEGDIISVAPPQRGRYYVYGLCDPVTHDVRYIGSTPRPHGRLEAHLAAAETTAHPPDGVTAWIATCIARGPAPYLRILEVHPSRDAAIAAEYALIRQRPTGLLNYHGSPRHHSSRRRPRGAPLPPAGCVLTRDAAAELGVSRQRIHQLIAAAGLTPRRVGTVVVLSRSDLAALRRVRQSGKRPGRPRREVTNKIT